MYFDTSSERRLPDLPLHRLDLPQVRPVFSSTPAIPHGNAADQALRKLSGLRLRVTLCRVDLAHEGGSVPRGLVEEIAARVEDPSLIVGLDGDATLVVLALGPRAEGRRGDLETDLALQRTLAQAVAGALSARCMTVRARMVAVHHWSDELDAGTRIAAVTRRAEQDHSGHALPLAA